MLGLTLALVVGAALGVLMGLSRLADLAFSDLTMAGLAIPAVIWALLTTMWSARVVDAGGDGVSLRSAFVVVNIAKATRACRPTWC